MKLAKVPVGIGLATFVESHVFACLAVWWEEILIDAGACVLFESSAVLKKSRRLHKSESFLSARAIFFIRLGELLVQNVYIL